MTIQKIQERKPNYIELAPIKAPITIGLEYQRKLVAAVDKMNKDLLKSLIDCYSNFESVIAKDASPVYQLQRVLKSKLNRYQTYFSRLAEKASESFISQIDKNDFRHLRNEFAKHSIKIRPDNNYIGAVNINKALIADNVDLITNIPVKVSQQIHGDLMRSIVNGGSLKDIESDLLKRGIQTTKRARFIARDQLFKATGAINNQRMIDNGITKAVWKHSHGDKFPRRNHQEANGRIYETAKGCPIKNEKGIIEFIRPGEKIGCTCYSTPYIEI